MTNPVATPTLAIDPSPSKGGTAVQRIESPPRPDREPSPSQPDLRLFIEKDETAGVFVYRIIDRRTGDVVQQFPRDQVLRLKDDPHYGPGTVIDARG